MSYWFQDTTEAPRVGKRMASQYQLGASRMAAEGTKPTYFHNASDVELFYPPIPTQTVRRTKPGGENVRRTAEMNDKRFQQIAINKETTHAQQLAAWHSQHDKANRAGERRRNDKQLTADLEVANGELKVLRRARLKQLLEAENQQYKRELAAKGLAILYDEP